MKRQLLTNAIAVLLLSLAIFAESEHVALAQWTTTGNDVYTLNTGNVGVGTSTPLGRLSITGGTLGSGRTDMFQIWPTRLTFQQTTGDETNTGTIDYRGFDSGALGIGGAGTSSSSRLVHISGY